MALKACRRACVFVCDLQSTGCKADMELKNAKSGVINEGTVPPAGQCLFRPLRKGTSRLGEWVSRKGKIVFNHCKQVWSRISFSKANSFMSFLK